MTAGFDFLRDDIRAAAPVSPAEAEALVADYYGLQARARPLGSQQDTNFLLVGDDGTPLGVLKIANAAFGPDEIDAQDAAADLLAAACPDLRIATALHRPNGRVATLASPDGPRLARVQRHLGGGTFTGPGYLAPDVVAGFGRIAGQVSAALADFTHPGLDRALQWDPRYADEVLRRLACALLDRRKLDRVLDAGAAAWAQVGAVAVLDVLAEEDLRGNAARVGAHLKGQLEALAARNDVIAAVHGAGLYLGVELVRDGKPATADTAILCDRLRELGVIMAPTGDHLNVLKIKPPLCLDAADADFFVDALDRALTDGW